MKMVWSSRISICLAMTFIYVVLIKKINCSEVDNFFNQLRRYYKEIDGAFGDDIPENKVGNNYDFVDIHSKTLARSGILKYPEKNVQYENNQHEEWWIEGKPHEHIQLTFLKFNLEKNCQFDSLTVSDLEEKPDHYLLLRKLTFCGRKLPETFTSRGHIVKLTFNSDSTVVGDGFEVAYKTTISGKHLYQDCGKSLFPPNPVRVIGGRQAAPNSWPWQLSLGQKEHSCGATVLTRYWVITAAHCVKDQFINPKKLTIVAGSHEKEPSTKDSNVQRRKIAKFVIYPGYGGIGTAPDAALLKLDKPLNLDFSTNGGTVHPICIPSGNYTMPPNTKCIVIGWGETLGSKSSGIVNELVVPLIDNKLCTLYYKKEFRKFEICAGYKNGVKDSCNGDSGGPLMCQFQGKYFLHGITSWGLGCALPKKPGVYTSVEYISQWIQDTISD